MPTIFRKTAKGQTEIETRVHRLTPRLRALLILVDGKRDSGALAALVPQQFDALIDELAAQGFIEGVRETAAAVAAPAPAPAAPAAPPGAPAASSSPDFVALRREAVRALTDAVGPAAETVAMRMERSRSLEELRPLLSQAAQVIANMRGSAAANAYAARFLSP
jgi:hypothetical protein